jgi:8-oxo-dGTP pyrophosphatase MutT (NUDIX family)
MRQFIDIIRSLLLENDRDHARALRDTGFWGSAGAGCIFLARDTNRILLCHRSNLPPPYTVEQPGTWGNWGGAIDPSEDPADAARREAEEELGYDGDGLELIPLYVFSKETRNGGTFRYHNFLAIVDEEFTPVLNWEAQGYRWCEWGQWPQPLHFGLQALFGDPASVQKIKLAMR